MKSKFTASLVGSLSLALLACTASAQSFSKKHIIDDFWAEGAAVADFNKDGNNDIAYGPWWFEGPDFKVSHNIYPATATWALAQQGADPKQMPGFKGAKSPDNGYSDNFIDYTDDFNHDGWIDLLVLGFPGKEAFWFQNPGSATGEWTKHLALESVDNESPGYLTVTKDGKKGIVCSSGGFLGYAFPDASNSEKPWVWHPVSPKGNWQKFTHGLGMGDINGDGRPDLLEAKGWWEQPASLENDPQWTFHETLFAAGGAQMLVTDVNGDGKADVITSIQAHGYGVAWLEQTEDAGGIGWRRHWIVGAKPEDTPHQTVFTQPHALALGDINGDGLPDLVTGKRFWAHGPKGGDPGSNDPAVLYWFELSRREGGAQFIPHLIDSDSGVGTQVTVSPLKAGGKAGIIVGNKKGAFVFEQQ
jgi:hypothetical protein